MFDPAGEQVCTEILDCMINDVTSASVVMSSLFHDETDRVASSLFARTPSLLDEIDVVDSCSDQSRQVHQIQPRMMQQSPFLSSSCGYLALHGLILLMHATTSGNDDRKRSYLRALRSPAAFWFTYFGLRRQLLERESPEVGSFWHKQEINGMEMHRVYVSHLMACYPPLSRLMMPIASDDVLVEHPVQLHHVSWLSRREVESGVPTKAQMESLDSELQLVRQHGGTHGFLIGGGDHWYCAVVNSLSATQCSASNITLSQHQDSISLNSPSHSSVPLDFLQTSPVNFIPRDFASPHAAMCSDPCRISHSLTSNSWTRSSNLEIIVLDSNNFHALTGNEKLIWDRLEREIDSRHLDYLAYLSKHFGATYSEAQLLEFMHSGNPFPNRIYGRLERIKRLYLRAFDFRVALSVLDACLSGHESASVMSCCAAIYAFSIVSADHVHFNIKVAVNLLSALHRMYGNSVSDFVMTLLEKWIEYLRSRQVSESDLASISAAVHQSTHSNK